MTQLIAKESKCFKVLVTKTTKSKYSFYLKLLHDQILQDITASILEFKFNLMSNQETWELLKLYKFTAQ